MIVSDHYLYVYVSIPKTGSLSVRTWLIENYRGRPVEKYHSCDVPGKYKNYLIFTTVRNPYARAYSFFKYQKYAGPFIKYLKRLPVYQADPPGQPETFWTQTQFVERSGATAIIKLENLPSVLRLPFIDKPVLPDHLRKTTDIAPPYEKYFTPEDEKAVFKYCKDDFNNFNYDRIYH